MRLIQIKIVKSEKNSIFDAKFYIVFSEFVGIYWLKQKNEKNVQHTLSRVKFPTEFESELNIGVLKKRKPEN